MTANKYTPGPWQLVVNDHGSPIKEIVGSDGRGICEVYEGDKPEAVWASAHVIAAAPELLEFIQHAADQLESGIQEYTESPEEPPQPASKWDYDAGQLVGELRRLIAQATGGAA